MTFTKMQGNIQELCHQNAVENRPVYQVSFLKPPASSSAHLSCIFLFFFSFLNDGFAFVNLVSFYQFAFKFLFIHLCPDQAQIQRLHENNSGIVTAAQTNPCWYLLCSTEYAKLFPKINSFNL